MARDGPIKVQIAGGGSGPGALAAALNQTGWAPGEVLAAGYLHQGKHPSMTSMITGTALVEVLRPRRSKRLPRGFVLAVTEDRVLAFKALGYSTDEDSDDYFVKVKPSEEGSFARSDVALTDLPDGIQSKSATLEIGGERFPVRRQNDIDQNTDELMELLAG